MVVGVYDDIGGPTISFASSSTGYEVIAVPNSFGDFAEGVNDAGTVVGNYYDALGIDHGYLAVAVPEPQPWVLMAAGLGLFGTLGRRRR